MRYLLGLEKRPGAFDCAVLVAAIVPSLLRDCLDGGGLELRVGEGVRIQFAHSSARDWRTWFRIVPIIGLDFEVE
jgi:hypothetical protein